jgi:hypothetical protein
MLGVEMASVGGRFKERGTRRLSPGALVRDLSGTALWNRNIRLDLPVVRAKAKHLIR